jgi:phosphoenolpyruvate phosphomutase
MRRVVATSFRVALAEHGVVRVAGAYDALGALLAQEAGFEAVWASGLGISAARGLPDASLLTMTEYVGAAAAMQRRVEIPVVADCDTGFGNNLNVAHMVHEYEAAGITAICVEDNLFPKMNSFVPGTHSLEDVKPFVRKIEVAKAAQSDDQFFLVARTEALIQGFGVTEAVARCEAYADAGADAVVIHSKAPTSIEVERFLLRWDGRCPVVAIPTTYPQWSVDEAVRAGVSVVIYANQGLRASVSAQRAAYRALVERGGAGDLEPRIAPLSDIFALQRLDEWREMEE